MLLSSKSKKFRNEQYFTTTMEGIAIQFVEMSWTAPFGQSQTYHEPGCPIIILASSTVRPMVSNSKGTASESQSAWDPVNLQLKDTFGQLALVHTHFVTALSQTNMLRQRNKRVSTMGHIHELQVVTESQKHASNMHGRRITAHQLRHSDR